MKHEFTDEPAPSVDVTQARSFRSILAHEFFDGISYEIGDGTLLDAMLGRLDQAVQPADAEPHFNRWLYRDHKHYYKNMDGQDD